MRDKEATVLAGERYRLPSATVVEVEAIEKDHAAAQCRYVQWDGRPSREGLGQVDVTLTVRFMQKFARRVWQ